MAKGRQGEGAGEREAVPAPVDIAVLTVIPAELTAVYDALGLPSDAREKDPDDGTVYHRGTIWSELAHDDYSLVLTCIGGAGNSGAAAAAAAVIAKFRPRAVLLMGIAAGIRGKVRVGEVVLSERVVSYEPAALVRSAGGASGLEPRPEIERMPHAMNQDVVNYRPDRRRLEAIFARAGGAFPSPPAGREEEFREHVATAISMRLGTIASGEKLLRDPGKLVAIRRELHGKVEAGEMEAAGVVDACRRSNAPWLVVRGISDFGDELKDDRFHGLAACAAAAVLVDFLVHGLHLGGAHRTGLDTGQLGGEYQTGLDTGIRSGFPRDRGRRPTFIFGRPIDRDQDFMGRAHEKDTILEAIDVGQPVQLLGESLMGKTSLLRWVQRHALLERPVIWVDPTRGLSPVSMVLAMAEALGKPERAEPLRRSGTSAQEAVSVLEAIVPFVLLIDDADALASLGSGFDVGFFNATRALVQSRRLTWVSASHRNLYDLFKDKGLTSAFLNDARKIWVGPVERKAAREIAGGAAAHLVDPMLAEAGGFAYGLQWLGDHLLRRQCSIDQACDAFANEMEPIFQRWWGGLEPQHRQLLHRCATMDVTVRDLDDRPRRRLRALVERGLVTEEDGRFMVEGAAWRSFVCDAG